MEISKCKFTDTKNKVFFYFSVVLLLSIFVAACKFGPSTDSTTWKVTIDQNGAKGLTQLVYEVKDGETLKQSDIQGTSTLNPTRDMTNPPAHLGRVFNGYKTRDGTDFTLDSTAVKSDLTIVQQWGFDPLLDCSTRNFAKDFLYSYSATGDVLGVACALRDGASISAKDATSYTALLYTAQYNQVEVMKYLVASGANLDSQDNNGYTALYMEAQTGNLDQVKYLLSNGASVTIKSNKGKTAFLVASTNNKIEVVKYLLSNGASITDKDNEANTALMLAVTNATSWNSDDNLNLIKYLATYTGIDLTATASAGPYQGKTALGIATTLATSNPAYNPIVTYLSSIKAP